MGAYIVVLAVVTVVVIGTNEAIKRLRWALMWDHIVVISNQWQHDHEKWNEAYHEGVEWLSR